MKGNNFKRNASKDDEEMKKKDAPQTLNKPGLAGKNAMRQTHSSGSTQAARTVSTVQRMRGLAKNRSQPETTAPLFTTPTKGQEESGITVLRGLQKNRNLMTAEESPSKNQNHQLPQTAMVLRGLGKNYNPGQDFPATANLEAKNDTTVLRGLRKNTGFNTTDSRPNERQTQTTIFRGLGKNYKASDTRGTARNSTERETHALRLETLQARRGLRKNRRLSCPQPASAAVLQEGEASGDEHESTPAEEGILMDQEDEHGRDNLSEMQDEEIELRSSSNGEDYHEAENTTSDSYGSALSVAPAPQMLPTLSNSELVAARPVDEEDLSMLQQADLYEYESPQRMAKKRRQRSLYIWGGLCGMLLLAIGFVCVVLFFSGVFGSDATTRMHSPIPTSSLSDTPSVSPTASPTPFLLQLPKATEEKVLGNPSSPQAKAYKWLSEDPFLLNHTDERKGHKFALATLFYSLGGDEWKQNENWLKHDVDECDWITKWINTTGRDLGRYGGSDVDRCDDDRIFTSLILFENGLKGTIPPEIFTMMTRLQVLDLAENDVTGSLPTEIGITTSLKDVIVDVNELSSTIPTEIGLLKNLYIFMAHSNANLSGIIPSEIGQLSSLGKLFLFNNRSLRGKIPSEFGLLTQLERLELHNSNINGSFPLGITSCQKLQGLLLDGTKMTGTIPTELGALTKLKYLGFAGSSQLKGTLISEIGLLGNLESLALNSMSLTGTIPSELGLLTKLTYLDLCCGSFEGTIPNELGMVSSLKEAYINYSPFVGEVPPDMCGIEKFSFDCSEQLCGCDECPCG